MKKFIVMLLTICMLGTLALSFTGCTPRSQILRVYNWGQYMSDDTWKGFESWYQEKTGEKIKVKYKTFDTNETMYTEIAEKKSDFDLICPSDYMLERMIAEGYIEDLNAETVEIVKEAVNPDLKGMITFDKNLAYSMPYMWGTIGIMYNIKAEPANVNSWSALFTNPGGSKNKIWMKDSVRDSYSVAMLYNERVELLELAEEKGYDSPEYLDALNRIFAPDLTDTVKMDEYIATAKNVLIAQKPFVKGYEVDNAKNDLLGDENGKNGEFGLFWSCDAGYIMSGTDEAPRCGGKASSDINYNLRYVIPDEGSNVWVDCFAIPKSAGNKDAANLFIQYLCDPDIAYDCMDEAGATSAITEAADKYRNDLKDMDFYKNAPDAFKENYVAMMFPDSDTLQRCAIMRDFGAFTLKVDEMWQAVLAA